MAKANGDTKRSYVVSVRLDPVDLVVILQGLEQAGYRPRTIGGVVHIAIAQMAKIYEMQYGIHRQPIPDAFKILTEYQHRIAANGLTLEDILGADATSKPVRDKIAKALAEALKTPQDL